MYDGRIAVRNPTPYSIDGPIGSYRIPADRVGEWHFQSRGVHQALFGDVVDRLGAYEECDTLEELNKVRRKFGVPEIKK